MAADRLFYADSSALVKLFVREAESTALATFIPREATLVSSALALVEVTRTVRVAGLEDEIEGGPESILDEVVLLDVDREILRRAASLASTSLRSLDAVHLSTAVTVEPEVMLAYDRGLRAAARSVGLRVEAPGAES
ncbi:MAG TPA: type II toxin-antitoxin system VapC family toxin [Gaiellaceae bacterium]|nr:type II toxin-antitoxin system VapC family toxin [Gaiellaceae bacterium]